MGLQRKVGLGRTAKPAFGALRRMKRLRGHWYDPFGRAEVRRLERALVPEYIDAVEQLAARLHSGNRDEATRIAALPDQVRGYEDLKLRRAAAYREELAAALAGYR
jgi:indolepyruvate ferredoxin oxidoreductase